MIEIAINKKKVLKLINDNTITVSHYGFDYFKVKTINARKLLEVIHEAAKCDKKTFVDYVNTNSQNPNQTTYVKIPMIDAIFANIKHIGAFKLIGYDELGSDTHIIMHRDIENVFPELKLR